MLALAVKVDHQAGDRVNKTVGRNRLFAGPFDLGEPFQYFGISDPHLHKRNPIAQAIVRAITKGQMARHIVAVEIHPIRVWKR